MATRKRTRRKPTWERAYRGHVLWLGKARLGRVTLAGRGRYTWEAAGRARAVDGLAKGKQAVGIAGATADKQVGLFRERTVENNKTPGFFGPGGGDTGA